MTTRTRFAAWAALAGIVAVLVTGSVALLMIDASLLTPVDDRIQSQTISLATARDPDSACRRVGSSAVDAARMLSVLVDDTEACRSNPAAPAPRSLDLPAQAIEPVTRTVSGDRWRVAAATRSLTDGRQLTIVSAEHIEASAQARTDAIRATLLAMLGGAVIATIGGVLAAPPATRRITRLLTRIQRAGADPTGTLRVGRVGGRDLDAAAASFDATLDELRHADAMQRRLLADAAHELRTPITSIRTNAQLLERDTTLTADAHDLASRIARQSAAVGDLVTGLVDHAAASAWRGDGAEDHDLAQLAQTAIDRAATRWPDAQLTFVDDAAGEQGGVHVDADLVIRALGNLIDNAIVHGSGTVRVIVGDGLLAVEDEGSGFPAELAERAFEPFVGDGGGLGLAFVRQVAIAHGGSVRVAPDAPSRVELQL